MVTVVGGCQDQGGRVTEYESVIQTAEEEADNGLYKEPYNTLGRA
jgi:hypothetical protein